MVDFKFLWENLFFATLAFWVVGCGTNADSSDPKALTSKDWFKEGVDRFYIARSSASSGSVQNIKGIGCYGENPDPETLVEIPVEKKSSSRKIVRLNQREWDFQFPLVTSRQPSPGECEVLFTGKIVNQSLGDELFTDHRADSRPVMIFDSAVTCGAAGLLTLGAIASKSVSSAYVASNIMTFYLCLKDLVSLPRNLKNRRIEHDKRILGLAFKQAGDLAGEMVEKHGDEGLTESKTTTLYTRYLVSSFNEHVNSTFENGWHNGDDFFRSVTIFYD